MTGAAMDFQLLNCRTGEAAIYKTSLGIYEENRHLHFCFTADHSACYCPYAGYNENHYEGDVCEVFIGVGSNPQKYYEIEVTPNHDLFLAEITYRGENDQGEPVISGELIPPSECFVSCITKQVKGGYTAEIVIDQRKLGNRGEPLCFNAFRIETDGGEMEKHLFALSPTLKSAFHVPKKFIPLQINEIVR